VAKGLPQEMPPKYKRGYPDHPIGIWSLDAPENLRKQIGRLTMKVAVVAEDGVLQDTYDIGGKAGINTSGQKHLGIEVLLRKDFSLQNMNAFIADLKQTIIHELEHTGQSEELLATADPVDQYSHGYDWNKFADIKGYYSSQAELEAYAKGTFKKAKVKNITYPEALAEKFDKTLQDFIRRYKKYERHGALDRLDYDEQDLRDYFQVELIDQILNIARQKYPRAHGLRECIRELLKEQNVLAQGMCFPFAHQKAEEWFEQHYTPPLDPDEDGQKHPDLNDKSKFKIVHGTVTDKWKNPPQSIVHAWVEMGDLVFDDQTQHTKPDGVDKDVYYDIYQPQPYQEFTASEAITNCIMKGGEGPWNDDLYAMMQDRDAWMNEEAAIKLDPVQDASSLEAFMDDYRSNSKRNPIGMPGDRYWYMGEIDEKYCLVITNLRPDNSLGLIKFNSIQTVPPKVCEGQGFASKVMDMITLLADKHNVTLRLDVHPFGRETLGVKDLQSWYKRNGFERSDEDYDTILTRQPNPGVTDLAGLSK